MEAFQCFAITPAGLTHPRLAIATARAGGVGLLDLEFCQLGHLELVQCNLEHLLLATTEGDGVGLRLKAGQVALYQDLIQSLSDRPHWLVICDWSTESLATALGALPEASYRRVLIEVFSAEQALTAEQQEIRVDGLVARGHEAGGWSSESSALILTQKLLQDRVLPVYVQGGIGVHTAAACRAAGAAGVVLDDQLWLMPESPLSATMQGKLQNLNGQEAIVVGDRLGQSCRVLSRPGFQRVATLQSLAEQIETEQDDALERTQNWRQQAQSYLGWGDPEAWAWPMGQAVGLAAELRDRYKTTGRFIQALLKTSEEHIRAAQNLKPLQPDSPLAVSHRTKFPIMQGPMTRVSDVADFALAVAQSGGLPMLALALMRQPQVESLLTKAQALMEGRSWGVGILGFVPPALREEQLAVVRAVKPPFALIAGGRPDQAAELEAEGIATYLHVPTPALLKMFLEAGARRFVFEGRECGGHVGPLGSFVLWESMIDTLLRDTPPGVEPETHIFFAGGIHDGCSAAMISAMVAPLAARGFRIGVLMGTAYTLTHEAVECGAILPQFQEEILTCRQTINLETGTGHASRCAVTPFAREFYETRRRMKVQGESPDQIKEALENLTLGRLRIASKGLKRDESGDLVAVGEDRQISEGMYMIGQVATLREQALSIQDLHEEVSVGGTAYLSQVELSKPESRSMSPSDIAIVGMSTLLPKADNPEQYWENILKKVDAIAEIPADRWDWRLYYDEDRHARDKVYSKWGGFLEDVVFDPMRFGIPPKSLKSIEPMQLLALEAVRLALIDAGYEDGDFDRENTSVILGCGGGIGDLGQQYATRSEIPRFVGATSPESWERLPEWTEESFPGVLLNVVAGRVASRFDFGGSNFTVDAACASSLAALDLAVKELEMGRANVAIAGGVDTVQSPFAYSAFSKTRALSPRGRCYTFDQNADGIVISEGTGMVVLKRLEDAKRDGDRIYAVIKAVASSSDGKALGLTAPLPAGQRRAFRRAYRQAGFSPNTLALYEAHGTGTAVGDRAELETLLQTLKAHQAKSKSCAIGSVKTMIGHTKSSAGIAALIKVALSLHYKVIPPHLNVEQPLEPIQDENSPVYLLRDARPWIACPDHARRGAVSAFGFGGTNFHTVLEEYNGNLSPDAPGGKTWSHELIVLRGSDRSDLQQQAQKLLDALMAGAEPRLRDLAYSCALIANRFDQKACLSIVAKDLEHLQTSLVTALEFLAGNPGSIALPPSIQVNEDEAIGSGKIAFLFPGQGCQYPQMLREAALYFPEVREAIETADAQLGELPKALSQYIYPPGTYSASEEAEQVLQLRATQITQPALGAVEMGLLSLVNRLELKADMVAGHSYGEYTALFAAGCLSPQDYLDLSAQRGRICAQAFGEAEGGMAAVRLSREAMLARLENVDGVKLANHNAPLQVIISGQRLGVEQVVETIKAEDIQARVLAVTGAFHTPFMGTAAGQLAEAIAHLPLKVPQIPVYSNVTASVYPMDTAAIKEQLAKHMLSPVEFVQQIEQMYADGTRTFIEVGPKSVLTNLTKMILEGKDHRAVSLDGNGGGLSGLLQSLGKLAASGIKFNLSALFEGRDVNALDLSRLEHTTRKPPLPKTAWLINGGSTRPQTESVGYTGNQPPLNYESFQETQYQQKKNEVVATPPLPSFPPSAVSVSPSPYSSAVTRPREVRPQKVAPPQSVVGRNGSSPRVLVPPTSTHFAVNSHQDSNQYSNMSPSNHHPATQPHAPLSAPSSGSSDALVAYQVYQETMRQFLRLEEQVMQQFLANTQGGSRRIDAPISSPAFSQPHSMGEHPPVLPQVTRGTVAHGIAPQSKPTPTGGVALKTSPSNPVPQGAEQVAPPVSSVVPTISAPTPAPTIPPPQPSVVPSSSSSNGKVMPKSNSESKSLDRDSLTQLLVELVSDRTGYPPEMLGLDQDLEAELGIDSIKRVEIVGALQKSLPADLAETLNQQMESLTRVKSLNGLVDGLLVNVPTSVVSDTSSNGQRNGAEPDPDIPITPLLDRGSLTQTLVELVSDRTGYPPDMLGLDQDLEAELGIDSIKRVEIVGALQKSLPADLAETLNQQMENLTRVKSLNALIDQLLITAQGDVRLGKFDGEVGERGTQRPSLTSPNLLVGRGANSVEPAPRFLMQPVQEPLPSRAMRCPSGLFLITEDSLSCAQIVAQQLQQQGATCIILPTSTLLNPEQLAASVDQLRQQHGPVKGIVHLAGLESTEWPQTLDHWRQLATVHVKSFYQLLQLCAQDLLQAGAQREAFLLSASLLGGFFGRSDHEEDEGLPTSGGAVGILKTLVKEWPGVEARAVDFDSHATPAELADKIVQELLAGGRLEVGYPRGQRTIFQTVLAPLATSTVPTLVPQSDWVVLVTGGARGITAEVAADLASTGLRLVLMGRSPEPLAESPLTQGIEDVDSLRRLLLQQAAQQGTRPTPVQIESQIRQIVRDREIRHNLERLQRGGAQVEYISADVRNEAELKGILDGMYQRYGRIDAVIHGAGIIEDKLIVDKTPESFNRVFDTKVDSLYLLAQHLRLDTLKLLVLFSSVAGRYGNRGQSDYGATNEVVNRFAWQLDRQWPHTRVVAINWGPWDTTGMASEDAKRQFREQGIIPIPLPTGRKIFLDEIFHGCKGTAEVIAGQGPWEASEAEVAHRGSPRTQSLEADGSVSLAPPL